MAGMVPGTVGTLRHLFMMVPQTAIIPHRVVSGLEGWRSDFLVQRNAGANPEVPKVPSCYEPFLCQQTQEEFLTIPANATNTYLK